MLAACFDFPKLSQRFLIDSLPSISVSMYPNLTSFLAICFLPAAGFAQDLYDSPVAYAPGVLETYPTEVFSDQVYPAEGYITETYPVQNFPVESYPVESYPTETYSVGSYPIESYSTETLSSVSSEIYPTQVLPAEAYTVEGAQFNFSDANATGLPVYEFSEGQTMGQPEIVGEIQGAVISESGGIHIINPNYGYSGPGDMRTHLWNDHADDLKANGISEEQLNSMPMEIVQKWHNFFHGTQGKPESVRGQ